MLLYSSDPDIYRSHISSIAAFLCDSWWSGTVKDKWVSIKYSIKHEDRLTSLELITSLLDDAFG